MLKYGTSILPPDINNSGISFTPNEVDNTILFGLGGISGINQDISRKIIEGRPYASFKEFYDYCKQSNNNEEDVQDLENNESETDTDEENEEESKNTSITKSKIIKLIQAGCFDSLNSNRVDLMKWLCVYENPKKESLTMQNMNQCLELNVNLPPELVKAYKFKQYVINKQFFYCNDPKFKSKKHYIVEDKYARPYLEEKYLGSMKEDQDYYYAGDILIIVDKALEKAMKSDLTSLRDYLSYEDILSDFNAKMWQKKYKDMIKIEDVNSWSMSATCFYHYEQHELDGIDLTPYNIDSFNDLPEEPTFIEKRYKNRRWKQYEISRICGTVLDRNDLNHTVDILTPDLEVVSVKMPRGKFSYYKQTISEIVNGKKKVLDNNWFQRGNIILCSGFRNGDTFFSKKYKNTTYQRSIILVEKINADGTLSLKLNRYGANEEE